MATTSFNQKFYVAENNINEFVDAMTKPSEPMNTRGFESKHLTTDELRKYVKEVASRDD